MRFSALCRRAALAHALLSAAALAQSSGPAGCTTGPASSCIDPVPATFLSGSWIQDDSASEWTLVANNGAPMTFGQVSGTVIVFPPDPNCPTVNYSVDPVSSNYSPSAISYPTEGSTTFQWKAVNPNPSGTCDTFTPVAWMVFQGTIPNKGNDTGSGTWNNSDQKSGPLAIETNLVITPSGEKRSHRSRKRRLGNRGVPDRGAVPADADGHEVQRSLGPKQEQVPGAAGL